MSDFIFGFCIGALVATVIVTLFHRYKIGKILEALEQGDDITK